MFVTKIKENKVISSEEMNDRYEELDVDPETGKRPKVLVTAAERCRARAQGLALQLEEGEKVVITEEAYGGE